MFIDRLDRGNDARDIADRRRRSDRHGIAIAHAMFFDRLANDGPIHARAAVDVDFDAAFFFEAINRIDRKIARDPI